MKIAIVGATGLVGTEMLKVLEERNFPFTELIPVASEKSIGKVIYCKANSFVTCGLEEAMDKNPDLALFSAGGTCFFGMGAQICPKRNYCDRQFLCLSYV